MRLHVPCSITDTVPMPQKLTGRAPIKPQEDLHGGNLMTAWDDATDCNAAHKLSRQSFCHVNSSSVGTGTTRLWAP